MEEEANQLYRRPQIMGQARDEEAEDCNDVIPSQVVTIIVYEVSSVAI